MKKIILFSLFLLFLTGCQPSPTETGNMDEFELSEQCPYVCWLGINPGITTAEEAMSIILSSNQINEDTLLELDEKTIYLIWETQNHRSSVTIGFEKGLVEGIGFAVPTNYKVNDFVNLLGKPAETLVQFHEEVEISFYSYILFFPLTRTVIFSSSANPDGPNPEDSIDHLSLNIGVDEITSNNSPVINIQPWLGYGHLQDYLPGVDISILGTQTPFWP